MQELEDTAATAGDRRHERHDLELTFNLFPALYAHPSWFTRDKYGFCGDKQSELPRQATFWVRTWSTALLRERTLERQFDCDFTDPAKRLALLDARRLLQLGVYAAAVLMRGRLRLIVNRADVAIVQATIGAEAHRCALRWTQPIPPFLAEGCDWTLGAQARWPDAAAWAARGALLVVSALPQTASGVIGRLQFKYPHEWSHDHPRRLALTDSQRSALVELLVSIVRSEFAEWAWLFAPTAIDDQREPADQPC